jgi:hypothetical protein
MCGGERMAWDKAKAFERVSNIYAYSREPLQRKDSHFHLYVPWDQSQVEDLMFQLKAVLNSEGSCCIPFMESDFTMANLFQRTAVHADRSA